MYFLEKVKTALQNLKNHKVLLKDPVGPNERPWLVMDPVGLALASLWGGGRSAPFVIWLLEEVFNFFKHQKSYQGTLGTQELPPTGSITSHGPSLGPTGSFKRTL